MSVSSSPRAATTAKFVGGRLARRSSEDIEKTLGLVVAALRAGPMKAEAIKASLGLDRKELPLVLKLGLKTKSLKKRGQKRGTLYSAAG
jgi:hypothetical protein